MSKQNYSTFSFRRILAISGNTFTQMARMKIFYFLIIFTTVVIGLGFMFVNFSDEQKLKLLRDVCFGAMSLFSWIFAISATALLIPKDIEDRTLYTILAKPVPRSEYLFGKYLGIVGLIFLSIFIMTTLGQILLWVRENQMLEDIDKILANKGLSSKRIEKFTTERRLIKQQGSSPTLWLASLAIFLKASVVTASTLLISTFASSFLFTLLSGFAVFFIGHFQSMVRDYWLNNSLLPNSVDKFLSAIVAIFFPNYKRFDITDQIISGVNFNAVSILSLVGLALLYFIVYYICSIIAFSNREL